MNINYKQLLIKLKSLIEKETGETFETPKKAIEFYIYDIDGDNMQINLLIESVWENYVEEKQLSTETTTMEVVEKITEEEDE